MESHDTPLQAPLQLNNAAGARRRRALPILLAALLAGAVLSVPHLRRDPENIGYVLAVKLSLGLAVGFAVLWWRAQRAAVAERAHALAADSLLRQSIEMLPCNFAVFDRAQRLTVWNRSYEKIHADAFATQPRPLTYAGLMRTAIAATHAPQDIEAELARRITAHNASDGKPFERRYPDGRWLRIVKQRLPGGHVAGFGLDITETREAEARAAHLARHDPLTGLANRAGFAEALERATTDPEGAALLLVDLDRFKQVNDRHGHEAGDAVLVDVAHRLRTMVRPQDVVCRLGGDEFAVIAAGLVDAPATHLAERLREALHAPCVFGSEVLPVGASIGLATAPAHAITAEALQRAADLALYEAKRAGRGRVRAYRPQLGEAMDREASLREDIATALERGEFALVWQPQRELRTGALLGAEAMLRWRNPRLGRLVPPDELLPVAAKAGLLLAVDTWVIEAAFAQAAAWMAHGTAPPRITINLSSASLADPALPQRIAMALATAGVPSTMLEIEIPAGLDITDAEATVALLSRLAAMGVGLALDDAGTGRAGLLHAARLPARRVKLDPSIVAMLAQQGGAGQRQGTAVLRAIMALASGLDLEVMATGVETQAQADALQREGISAVQGYLTGRPVLAEDFFAAESVAAGR